jgi:hypothetical protein
MPANHFRTTQSCSCVSSTGLCVQLPTSDLQPPFLSNSLSFTLLSKIASANHLESHSCKNKGLKVPCFHTLTKKGVGEGGSTGGTCPERSRGHRAIDARQKNKCLCAAPNLLRSHESPITSHRSLFVSPSASTLTRFVSATPLDSALTSKRVSKSFASNTYEKHTGGEGGRVSNFAFRVSAFDHHSLVS